MKSLDLIDFQHLGSIQFLIYSGLTMQAEREYVDPGYSELGDRLRQALRKRFGSNAVMHEMIPWFQFGHACWVVADLEDYDVDSIKSVIAFVLGGVDAGETPVERTPAEELLLDCLQDLSTLSDEPLARTDKQK